MASKTIFVHKSSENNLALTMNERRPTVFFVFFLFLLRRSTEIDREMFVYSRFFRNPKEVGKPTVPPGARVRRSVIIIFSSSGPTGATVNTRRLSSVYARVYVYT